MVRQEFPGDPTIAVLGLGYVGLPLATHFAKHYNTIGLDINRSKIEELRQHYDRMGEVSADTLKNSPIQYTSDPAQLNLADIVVVAVPTPVDSTNNPDLTPVRKASESAGKYLKPGAVVSFESTVYPGVTEEICVPILEQESGMAYNREFFVGYSPERVNPGDKEHTIDRITKIVSGSTPEVADYLKDVYGKITRIHLAPSIKVAEAAKAVENTQRDINIALVNELAILCDPMGIDIHDVLAAAGTKWNFHPYTPGLVGGHCIGVDPYYLARKAEELGQHPDVILAGRRRNDSMHEYYAKKVIKELNRNDISASKAKVAVFGLTFKENCSDYRNSRAKQLIEELREYGADTFGVDPWLPDKVIREEFGAKPRRLEEMIESKLDAAIITVPHREFQRLDLSSVPVILDVKGKTARKPVRSASGLPDVSYARRIPAD